MRRVYFITRSDLTKNPAGDTIQVLKTMEYLRERGVDVHLSSTPQLTGNHLYHLFNINRARDLLPYLQAIKERRGEIVLSPIYWNMEEYLSLGRRGLLEGWRRDAPLRKRIVEEAHLLLPNGRRELEMVIDDLGEEGLEEKASIIPNGVDSIFYNPSPEPFIKEYGIKDFILSVGRISRRKNQLALIKAIGSLSIPLVIIGHINDPLYYRQCRNLSAKTIFLPHLSQESLASAYAAAKVHVLCSWFDTPGLVSLEAALAGCSIVTTDRGTAREYFQEEAWYCQPHSISSIRGSILAALKVPPPVDLPERIMKSFSWEVVAEKTLKAYRRYFCL